MKKLFFLAIISFGAGCTSTENPQSTETSEYPQEWVLVEMSGSVSTIPPTRGSDMVWQESIRLQSDGTFTKTRTHANEVLESSGTYRYEKQENEQFLVLEYEEETRLVASCSSQQEEWIAIYGESQMRGTWEACDGPGLVYKRI